MRFCAALVVILSVFVPTSATAETVCDDQFGKVCIETSRQGAQVTFFALNRHPLLPVTLSMEMNLQNLAVSSGALGPFVLDGSERRALFTLEPAQQGAWRYDYTFSWSAGDFTARHDDSYRYALPFEPARAFAVGQGCNGRFSHFGNRRYSVDFDMPVGTPVHAARAGRVVVVKEDSNRGGPSEAFATDGNHITIQHDDRTLAQYFHLREGGAVVEPGDRVGRGQLIGYSGNTGVSTGPHLHFDVIKGSVGTVSQSVRFSFDTATGAVTCPPEGTVLRTRP